MGQICMWEEIPSQSFEDIISRDRIVGYIFPTVYSVFSLFFFFKVKDCVNSQCLSRTSFGSVGLLRDRNRLRQIMYSGAMEGNTDEIFSTSQNLSRSPASGHSS